MLIHNDVVQGTDEWLQLRLGKFTASDFHILMGDSQTKKILLLKKAAERITGKLSDSDRFSNIHTERGNENEALGRELYSVIAMIEVDEVGFVELSGTAGCSPDGLIGLDGGIEIKCKDNHNHLFCVMNNYIEPSHKTQMQFCMMVTGAKWWDYVLYNPNFNNPLHIIRIKRDEDYITKIRECLEDCENKVQTYIAKFNNIGK
jgi:predicted phage-related endonuclease